MELLTASAKYTALIGPFCPIFGVVSQLPIHSQLHGAVTVAADLAKVNFSETTSVKPMVSCQNASGKMMVS